jgi:hypothetical protein
MSRLPKRHFWEWFKRHHKEYLELKNKPAKEARYWLQELDAHLRAYFKFLEFTLAVPNEGIPTLTISVNGKAKYFKKADAFVATAPEIPGWTIRALDDPNPIDFFLEKQMEDTGIDPREFFFSFVTNDPRERDITVYHPLCTSNNEHQLLQLASAAIYNLLGERSFGTDIGSVEVVNLSLAADTDELHPLEELPAHISMRSSSLFIDDHGNLQHMH